jgi:hypothetical protein
MTPTPEKPEKKLLYLDKSTPDEFINAKMMDWVYLVGDIDTEYNLNFVQQFGHAMKSRPLSNEIKKAREGVPDALFEKYMDIRIEQAGASFHIVIAGDLEDAIESLRQQQEREQG